MARHGGAAEPKRYRCEGFDPIEAGNIARAAQLFAVQIALKKYGPEGRCRSVHLISDFVERGSTFEAYVGIPDGVAWHGVKYQFEVNLCDSGVSGD
jgi:hypothetical protein